VWKESSSWLHRVSSTWVTLSALLAFLLFSALILPAQSSRAEAYSGTVGSPDTSFFYSADDLYDIAQAYGEQGRAAYVRSRFTFDVVWPLIYMLFLSTAISWVYTRALPADGWWQLANLVPILGALSDYLENVSTSIVMLRYPAQTAVVDALAPIFTLVKWILIGSSFGLLVAGALIGIWRRARKTLG